MNRRPSEVLRQNRDLIRSVALLHRTENLRVFGSIVRGEDTEASDLDLLVDPLPGATLLDLGAIQIELQEPDGQVDAKPVEHLSESDISHCVIVRRRSYRPTNSPELRPARLDR